MTFFLYQPPFVDTKGNVFSDWGLDHFTETDRGDQRTIYDLLLKVAREENIISIVEDGFKPTADTNTGSWIYLVNWMNFRSLVDENKYHMLMNSLFNNDESGLNVVIDLHVRLGGLFDPKLLNTLVHRVLSAVSAIPYKVPKESKTLTWTEIHVRSPFLWLLILMQNLIKSEGFALA